MKWQRAEGVKGKKARIGIGRKARWKKGKKERQK